MAVLLILLTLLLLLLITPVGVYISYGQELLVRVRFGFLRMTAYPPKKTDQPEKEKKAKNGVKAKRAKPTREQILYSIDVLLPALKRALQRTRRRVRIDPLDVKVVFGGDDPADVAILYGKAQGLVSGLMPTVEQVLTVKNRQISLSTDYESAKIVLTAEVGVRLLVWDGLGIGLGLVKALVKWLIGYRKLGKMTATETSGQTTDTTTSAGAAGAA